MIRGLGASFDSLPLMSAGVSVSIVNVLVGLLHSATTLAIQLAAPIFITMLIVDVVLGMLSKTVPQLNILSAGIPIRAGVGLVVAAIGIVLTVGVLRVAMVDSLKAVETAFSVVKP